MFKIQLENTAQTLCSRIKTLQTQPQRKPLKRTSVVTVGILYISVISKNKARSLYHFIPQVTCMVFATANRRSITQKPFRIKN